MSVCRWCSHESILTEDASPLLSALQGGSTPQAQAQAQMMQQATEAARVCRQCGAQAHPVTGGQRLNGSGWFLYDNPDGSLYIEVFPPPKLEDGKKVWRVTRWTLSATGPADAFAWCRNCAWATYGGDLNICCHCGSRDVAPSAPTPVHGVWTATLHDSPGGKREAGRPWEPVGEVAP
jgi:hypothetical protein